MQCLRRLQFTWAMCTSGCNGIAIVETRLCNDCSHFICIAQGRQPAFAAHAAGLQCQLQLRLFALQRLQCSAVTIATGFAIHLQLQCDDAAGLQCSCNDRQSGFCSSGFRYAAIAMSCMRRLQCMAGRSLTLQPDCKAGSSPWLSPAPMVCNSQEHCNAKSSYCFAAGQAIAIDGGRVAMPFAIGAAVCNARSSPLQCLVMVFAAALQ